MAGMDNCPETAASLRRRAEDILRDKSAWAPQEVEALSPAAARLTLHELRVHQIELEMQNEELRQSQAELEAARARYFDLYDLAPIGYVTLDEKGVVSEANIPASTLLGMARNELVRQPFFRFILTDDRDIYYLHRKHLVESGEPQACELRMVKKDGAVFWAHLAATAAQDPGGETSCRIVISDITGRRQTEEALRDLNKNLEMRVLERTVELEKACDELLRRNAQFRALVARLAHKESRERRRIAQFLHDNFQQLLVAAKRKTAMILSQSHDPDLKLAGQQVVEIIDQSIAGSRTLIMELAPPILHDAGFEAGMHWLSRWMAEEYELAVDVSGTMPPAPLPEDLRILLFHAVRELLVNIVKHARVKSAQVTMSPANGGLRITVSDEGHGFDAAVALALPRTFGLFNIQERLALLDGRLDIASKPGAGTTIGLYVPLPEPPPPRADLLSAPGMSSPGTATASRSSGNRIRVLVADDHSIIREGLLQMLSREADLDIVGEAQDGQDALDKAQALRPDVILMDVSMPRMSGLDATRHITSELPETRVIGLSMHAGAEMAAQMRAAGAKHYLEKDSPIEEIVAAIRAVAQA